MPKRVSILSLRKYNIAFYKKINEHKCKLLKSTHSAKLDLPANSGFYDTVIPVRKPSQICLDPRHWDHGPYFLPIGPVENLSEP